MFLSGEELKSANGSKLFSPEEIKLFYQEWLERKKELEKKNIALYHCIVPNKANIYPEYLPDHLSAHQQNGYGYQVLSFLRQNHFPVIGLYDTLLNAKKHHLLYFYTDNHWNDAGASIAAHYITGQLGIPHRSNTPKHFKARVEKSGEIARILGIREETSDTNFIPTDIALQNTLQKESMTYPVPQKFPYPELYQLRRKQAKKEGKKLLLIRDSFGNLLFPYLAEYFRESLAIYDNWEYGRNEAIISAEQPDIVLYCIVESNIPAFIKRLAKSPPSP